MKIKILHFLDLSVDELYDLLKLRSDVFVVEQDCVYADLDDLDQDAIHALGLENDDLVAYARILKPDVAYKEPAIGRVVTSMKVRGRGLGKEIFQACMEETDRLYPEKRIRIMAQVYLVKFYQIFGFQIDSEEFLEDGIPHVEMIKS